MPGIVVGNCRIANKLGSGEIVKRIRRKSGAGWRSGRLERGKMAEAHASRDDDALKKNTDCVYFLASPLTCKKVCVHFCCSVCSPSSITCFSPLISHSDQTILLSFPYPGFLPLQTGNLVFLCIFWGARILGFGAQLDCLGL